MALPYDNRLLSKHSSYLLLTAEQIISFQFEEPLWEKKFSGFDKENFALQTTKNRKWKNQAKLIDGEANRGVVGKDMINSV